MQVLILLFISLVFGANRGNFRTCADSPFCREYRKTLVEPKPESWRVIQFDSSDLGFTISNAQGLNLNATLSLFSPGILRLTIQESNSTRYSAAQEVINLEDLQIPKFTVEKTDKAIRLSFTTNFLSKAVVPLMHQPSKVTVTINFDPFRLDLAKDGELLYSINNNNRLMYKPSQTNPNISSTTFNGELDESSFGDRSVGIDVDYCNVESMHGLAEHAVSWDLPTEFPNPADHDEPYRFWNSDVFAYELESPMATYASIPLLQSTHYESPTTDYHTSGLFWLNPSETFVHLSASSKSDSGCSQTTRRTWWVSESGDIDIFMFTGDSLSEVTQKFSAVTGTTAMQQINTLGVHQSRWNYFTTQETLGVQEDYESNSLPLDYIWLDIDHSLHRKYFVWNPVTFPDPQNLTDQLAARKRNLVVIVDPHIKAESGYKVHDELDKNHLFVTDKNGVDFQGWCWPGNSKYADVLLSETRKIYEQFYSPSSWPGTQLSPTGPPFPSNEVAKWLSSAHSVHLWNDMNEPSVFNKPEVTIPRSMRHLHSTVEHRDVHNVYGLFFHKTTYESLVNARGNDRRQFVLTRAAFAGSQRYGPIWTGDNAAEWDHLKMSIPMILSLNACGYSNSGADVGGFFGETSPLLMVRWSQLAIWFPFLRYHATLGTARREPYLLPEIERKSVQTALNTRYRLIPFWYTLLARSHMYGVPMITSIGDFELRQRLVEKSKHIIRGKGFLSRQDGFIVRPIVEVTSTEEDSFILPGSQSVSWWSMWSNEFCGRGGDSFRLSGVDFDNGPAFVRGKSIFVSKERYRRSVEAQRFDPYTINVYLDPERIEDGASGILYIDDGQSLNSIKTGRHAWIEFKMSIKNSTFTLRPQILSNAVQDWIARVNTKVERIEIRGFPEEEKLRRRATLNYENGNITEVPISWRKKVLVIKLSAHPELLGKIKWTVVIEN